MSVVALVLYVMLISILYGLLRLKIIKSMVKKHIMTPTSAKEFTRLLDAIYLILLIFGTFIGILSLPALAFLLAASLIIIPFILHDLLRSIVYYYMLVSTKMVENGRFVILTRGIRGWIKRITPFFIELRGEYEETIRVPNSLVAMEPVRIPSRSLPFVLNVKFSRISDYDEVEGALKDAVLLTKRHSVVEPKIKLKAVGNDWVEYEIMYGLGTYEAANEIMKILINKLKRLLEDKGIYVEIRREHAIMSR
ncbi:MAG: mechanosensitive ion channel family protein [Crenarchaeota archaeon]|nr:mechanosensitive ion channel family protein [Thermoproteota archaeon]